MLAIQRYEGSAFFNFIESLNSEVTKRNYAYSLKQFLKHYAIASTQDLLTIVPDSLEDLIKKYLVHQVKDKHSPVQARIDIAAIRHFCKMNKIKLDWDLIAAFKGKTKSSKNGTERDDAYSHEQINQLLSICNIRGKAVILIYASTGIRLSALISLKIKHIEKVEGLYKFIIDEDDGQYFTFCTPECVQTIDQYLAYRERYGEKLDPESPLIREEFTTRLKRKKPVHIKAITIQSFISNYLTRLGLRTTDHINGTRSRKKVKLIHGFRKFFETQLLQSDVNYVVVKMLMGHDLKLEESYFRPKLEYIIAEYSKAIDSLTIDPANRLKRELVHEQAKNTETSKILARLAKLEGEIGIKI